MNRLIVGCFAAVLAIGAIISVAHAHDWYTGLQNQYGHYCCNKHDFKPVQAWQDDDGLWHAMYPNDDGTFTEYVVTDPKTMVDDNKNQEPFQAHMAIVDGGVRCFLRKATGG
jgi:hypothetical protein